MAFVLADWSISAAKVIDYIGDAHAGTAPTYSTGIEFHRGIQDLADNPEFTGDDEMSIIKETPTDRAGADTNIVMLNGYTVTVTGLEHIYDCSITQDGGDTIDDGIQVFGNANTIQIIQNGAILANDFWNEPKMIAATSDAASSTSHRFLVRVRSAGSDIDGRRLLGTQREFGTLYTEFFIGGGTNRGNNTLALKADSDNNNQTAVGTVATWTDIVNDNEGYSQIDANGDGADENYYSDWELAARSKNDFYERAKWIQREGSSETIYGLDGDIFRGITHEIPVDTGAGTWVEPESLSWTGGTGQLLAVDNTAGASSTKLWIQLLTGQAPGDGVTITGNGGATADVNGSATAKIVPSVFVGASTGTALIGAFGLGVGADDLVTTDRVTDLSGTTNQPPNNVQFIQQNLVVGDRVLIGPEDGAGGLDLDQLSLNTTLSSGTETAVVTTAAIPTDTPSSGTIRVELDSGVYKRVTYTSYTGSTFTIPSTDFSGDNATAANNIFVSYLDLVATGTSEFFTSVFLSPRTLFIRVRNSSIPIKTFESTGTLGSGGGSSTTGRIADD